MLQNNGPYGPNDVPVNMGAPVNGAQLNAPMNVVQNLNNLGKMPQSSPQTAAGHFSLPNFPSYSGTSSNMGSQSHQFPNYHGLSVQPSYMPQGSAVLPNLNWQNGMLPMNLNMHSEQAQNASNYPNIDRRTPENVSNSKESYFSKVPLNVPQFQNNFYQRHIESESNSQSLFNNHFKPYDSISNDISVKPPERLLCDNTRRKNLENTVRLIENILINTTKNREMQRGTDTESESRHNSEKLDTVVKTKITDTNCTKTVLKAPNIKENVELSRKSLEINSITIPERLQVNNIDSSNIPSQQSEDIKPVNDQHIEEQIEIKVKLEPEDSEEEHEDEETIKEVEVKIEPITSWTDTEHTAPFLKDIHGVLHEDVGCGNVIDSDNSVAEATKLLDKNLSDRDSDSYFECPYCSLLFKHPKRFLIHTKWHMFGLINEQRIEMAKEKEIRKNQRKEARQQEKGQSTTRKPWPCKDCDKIFHARGGLESHRKRYHTNRIRECKMCAKTITGWGPWRAHVATHSTTGGFQCAHCPKRFKYSHSLTKHNDTHLEKTHACPECPKKFGSPALLKVHMKSHERMQKGASFHCSFCGKAFFDKFNLQIHERTHTNERPFVCEICNATFGCNSNLQRHMKVSHSSTKPYECSTCHRSFASEGIRDRHELRVHGDPEDFKYVCKQCPNRYMKLIELKKHTYKVHPKSKSKKATDESK